MQFLLVLTFALTISLAAASVAWGFVNAVMVNAGGRRLRVRLRNELGISAREATRGERFSKLVATIFERMASPFVDEDGKRRQHLRRDLVKAGIYSPQAYRFVLSVRILLLAAGLAVGYLAGAALGYDWLMTMPLGGIFGYLLPQFWLRQRIRQNHRLLERALPDGLDLMVICVEAGLTMDAAIQRVAEELLLAHPALARELSICTMETRIGLPRAVALQNLGKRTDFPPIQGLTAMLIQTDRFGTSVADALRVQADSIRRQRQNRAEEAAARASVKLSFPLVLFIFPASFLILAGPMIIHFMINGFFGGD